MKRYNLTAEFVRWEGKADLSDQVDSFEYVVEVESEEEAHSRLDALIIERMASKPGWTYRLIRSGISEFLGFEQSSPSLSDLSILAETIRPTEPSELSTPVEPPSDPSTPQDMQSDQSQQATESVEEVV